MVNKITDLDSSAMREATIALKIERALDRKSSSTLCWRRFTRVTRIFIQHHKIWPLSRSMKNSAASRLGRRMFGIFLKPICEPARWIRMWCHLLMPPTFMIWTPPQRGIWWIILDSTILAGVVTSFGKNFTWNVASGICIVFWMGLVTVWYGRIFFRQLFYNLQKNFQDYAFYDEEDVIPEVKFDLMSSQIRFHWKFCKSRVSQRSATKRAFISSIACRKWNSCKRFFSVDKFGSFWKNVVPLLGPPLLAPGFHRRFWWIHR